MKIKTFSDKLKICHQQACSTRNTEKVLQEKKNKTVLKQFKPNLTMDLVNNNASVFINYNKCSTPMQYVNNREGER